MPGEAGAIDVLDSVTATARISIAATAALSPRDIQVVSGVESVSSSNGFSVQANKLLGMNSAVVSTIAGTAGIKGFSDGVSGQARFQ